MSKTIKPRNPLFLPYDQNPRPSLLDEFIHARAESILKACPAIGLFLRRAIILGLIMLGVVGYLVATPELLAQIIAGAHNIHSLLTESN